MNSNTITYIVPDLGAEIESDDTDLFSVLDQVQSLFEHGHTEVQIESSNISDKSIRFRHDPVLDCIKLFVED